MQSLIYVHTQAIKCMFIIDEPAVGWSFSVNYYQRLFFALLCFILGWICLALAARDLQENPPNLVGAHGVPAAVVYVALMQGIGCVAVVMSGLGMLVFTRLSVSSYRLKISAFFFSTTLLVLASLLGILINIGYVLDTLFSVIGIALYVFVIVLVIFSVPRRK